MVSVNEDLTSRSALIADQFESAQEAFIQLIESLDEEQWQRVGRNGPQRLNDEDEGRTVGVIAHHVAASGPFIMGRIRTVLAGNSMAPVDIHAINAAHAVDKAAITRQEVVDLLRATRADLVAEVRAMTDAQLEMTVDSPVGPMSVQQRLERVLIGHLKGHQASIEAAIA